MRVGGPARVAATFPGGSAERHLASRRPVRPILQLMRRTAALPSSTVARHGHRAWAGRRSLVVAISLLGSLGAPAILATDARADSIDDKRAEAEAIADEIEANGMRISQFDEELLEAQLTIGELQRRIDGANHDIDGTRKQARHQRAALADRALVLYMSGGSGPLLPALDGESFSDAGARQVYLETAAARDSEIINDLQASNHKLGEQIDALEQAQAQAETEQRRLDDARAELASANARQEQLLERTQGELAELVAAEQARQAREAEARARAEQEQSDAANANDSGGSDGTSDSGSNGGGDGGNDPGITVVAPNPRAQIAVDAALAQLGTPYSYATPGSWDDPDPDSFDCSGLTGWAWYQAGVSLPHSSRAQFASLPHVAQSDLLPGDLVFYGSPIHHVGMYIGSGQYVNAPQTGEFVRIRTIYRDDWAGAARVPG